MLGSEDLRPGSPSASSLKRPLAACRAVAYRPAQPHPRDQSRASRRGGGRREGGRRPAHRAARRARAGAAAAAAPPGAGGDPRPGARPLGAPSASPRRQRSVGAAVAFPFPWRWSNEAAGLGVCLQPDNGALLADR